jgi:hypothetical protein
VRLRLSTAARQTQFHIGEPISVTLTLETDGSQSLSVGTGAWFRRPLPLAAYSLYHAE